MVTTHASGHRIPLTEWLTVTGLPVAMSPLDADEMMGLVETRE
ncbi:MAG: hypothetical protein RLZZ305_1407 [Actinomycetota bacterium]